MLLFFLFLIPYLLNLYVCIKYSLNFIYEFQKSKNGTIYYIRKREKILEKEVSKKFNNNEQFIKEKNFLPYCDFIPCPLR